MENTNELSSILDKAKKYFPEDIYLKNAKYIEIEKSIKDITEVESEKQQKKLQAENEETQKHRNTYEMIKNGSLKKSDHPISLSEAQSLWATMLSDDYGQQKIQANANQLRIDNIKKENVIVKERTLNNYKNFIHNSNINGICRFTSVKKEYILRKQFYTKVFTNAKEIIRVNYQKYPGEFTDQQINAYAIDLINEDPLAVGRESDYIVTYSMILEYESGKTRTINTGERFPIMNKVEIKNVPSSFIEKYNYQTDFKIDGNPDIIENTGNTDLDYGFTLVFDFNKLRKIESNN
jgi:hypothetical protein